MDTKPAMTNQETKPMDALFQSIRDRGVIKDRNGLVWMN